MESLLTQAAIAVELFGAGYVVSSFAAYAHHRFNQSTSWKVRGTSISVEQEASKPVTSPKKRKPTPTELLRQQCQKAGIKWRHAHGKNKHLKKHEMIAALQELERMERKKRRAASPPQTANPVTPHEKAA